MRVSTIRHRASGSGLAFVKRWRASRASSTAISTRWMASAESWWGATLRWARGVLDVFMQGVQWLRRWLTEGDPHNDKRRPEGMKSPHTALSDFPREVLACGHTGLPASCPRWAHCRAPRPSPPARPASPSPPSPAIRPVHPCLIAQARLVSPQAGGPGQTSDDAGTGYHPQRCGFNGPCGCFERQALRGSAGCRPRAVRGLIVLARGTRHPARHRRSPIRPR